MRNHSAISFAARPFFASPSRRTFGESARARRSVRLDLLKSAHPRGSGGLRCHCIAPRSPYSSCSSATPPSSVPALEVKPLLPQPKVRGGRAPRSSEAARRGGREGMPSLGKYDGLQESHASACGPKRKREKLAGASGDARRRSGRRRSGRRRSCRRLAAALPADARLKRRCRDEEEEEEGKDAARQPRVGMTLSGGDSVAARGGKRGRTSSICECARSPCVS